MFSAYAQCIRTLSSFERGFDFDAVPDEHRGRLVALCDTLREDIISFSTCVEGSSGRFEDVHSLLSTVSQQLSELQGRIGECSPAPLSSPSATPSDNHPHPSNSLDSSLGDRCPSFAGKFPITGRGVRTSRGHIWVDVYKGPCSLNETQFRTWLTYSNTWALKDVSHSRKSDVVTFRAYCRFGGSARIYSAQLESGSKCRGSQSSRGFMKVDDGFVNCPCMLKAVVSFRSGGTVVHGISVLVDNSGNSHTHGDFIRGPVDHKLTKVDPSLVVHNAINSTAIESPFLRPVQVLCSNTDKIESDGYSHVLTDLNRDLLRNVQSLCARARGLSGKINLEELYKMKHDLHQEWMTLPAVLKDHMPRIIGISHQVSREGDKFAVVISTTSMMRNAAFSVSGLLAVDCTFKVNACDYPLLIISTEDYSKETFPIAFTFVHSEDTSAYVMALTQVKLYVEKLLNLTDSEWYPRYIMGDGSFSIDAAIKKVFAGKPCRLQCYFHVLKQIRTQLKSLGLNKSEKNEFISQIQKISRVISVQTFKECIQELRRFWVTQNKPRLIEYINAPNGYFDPDATRSRWYRVPFDEPDHLQLLWLSRTNNGLESLNGRVKDSIFGRHLFGFRAAIAALFRGLKQLSYKACSDAMASRPRSRVAPKPHSGVSWVEIHKLKIIEESPWHLGRMYQFSDDEYNLVYVPVDDSFLLEPPQRGGPFCTCREFLSLHGICRHVGALCPSLKEPSFGDRTYRGRPMELPIGQPCSLQRLRKKRKRP